MEKNDTKISSSNTIQSLWVAMGSLASFAFSIVSAAILSRYFAKEDYGTYKQVMYVYSTLLTVFTLGLPKSYSYFLPRVSKEEGLSLVNKITNIFFILGAIFSLFLFFGSSFITDILKNDSLESALKIFAPVPFLMLPTMGIESIYATYRETFVTSIYTVVTRVLMLVCVSVPVILFDGNVSWALVGFTLSSLLTFLIALYLKQRPFRNLVKQKCDVTYKSIFKFSLPLLYASIFGTIIASADQFFVSRYFGAAEFAEFSNGFMELPFVGMIVGACTTVLFPLFSKIEHESNDAKSEIIPIWQRVFDKTSKLVYPLLVFCWFMATDIMVLLYGGQYAESDTYFRIKLVTNIFTLIAYAPLFLAIGKTKAYANIHLIASIFIVVVEYACVIFIKSPIAIAVSSVVCRIGIITSMLVIIAKHFNMSFGEVFPLGNFWKILLPCAAIGLIIQFISIENVLIRLVVCTVVYTLLYVVWAYVIKLNYKDIVNPFVTAFKLKFVK